MQYFPSSPLARGAEVERRQRSWIIHAGSRQFGLTRIEYRSSPAVERYVLHRRRAGARPTQLIGAMLGVLGGVTLLGVAITSSRASAGYRYVLSLPIPPVRPFARPAPVAAAPAMTPHMTQGAVKHAPSRVAASGGLAIGEQVTDYTADSSMGVPEPAAANTLGAAMRAAMTTGRLQQWATADGGERGFIVVGPVEGGTDGCRAVSILTRRDGDNHVERRRECEAGPAQDDAR